MYYRYKTKKNSGGVFRIFVFAAAAAAVIISGYRFRSHLMFWKTGYKKLNSIVAEAERDTSVYEKSGSLQMALEKSLKLRNDEPLNADAYIVSGKISFIIAEASMPEKFGRMTVNSTVSNIPESSIKGFYDSVRFFRKAEALKGKKYLDDESKLMVAKAAYYTGYYSPSEIFEITDSLEEPLMIKYSDDIYFYAQTLISGGAVKNGIDYLAKMNMSDPFSKLVLAKAYEKGKQYTDSIAVYRDLISACPDSEIVKMASLSLGKLFFSQSLFREAAETLQSYVSPQSEDLELADIMFRSYTATGEADKAKMYQR